MNIAQIKKVGIIDSWVDTSGQILEIKEQKTRTTKNRLMAKVKIGDETDQIGAWLYIDTNSVVLNQIISIRAMLKEWNSNRYLDYGKIQSQQQTAPPNAPQAPQNALQSTNNKKDVDWDAISRGKVRHGVVTAYISAGTEPAIYRCEYWTNYIMTGKDPDGIPDPDPSITEGYIGDDPPPPTDDEIPF